MSGNTRTSTTAGGLGGIGVVLIGVLVWHDKISPQQVIGMLLIVVGTLALNAVTTTVSQEAPIQECEHVPTTAMLADGKTMTAVVEIPESHRDLIDGPYTVALTTVMPDGQPQTTPVWCNRHGDFIFINVMKGFRKEKNIRLNPKVSLLAYDPQNPLRNIEMRGCVVEMTEEGALEHDDELARLYLGKPDAKFFGDAVPSELQSRYTPVRVKIVPTHIRVEG